MDSIGVRNVKSYVCEVLKDQCQELKNVLEHIGDSDNVITWTQFIDEEVYEVGVDSIDVEEAFKRGIKVVNRSRILSGSVVAHPVIYPVTNEINAGMPRGSPIWLFSLTRDTWDISGQG